jgi:maleate cis-trans isomerase
MTNDIKLKISNSNKGKIFSKETRLKLSKAKTERSIKLILDNNTGVFYYSCEEASFFTGYKKSHLSKMLTGNLKNKTNLIYV